jgi:serine/threonine-protein phosphatase 2A activator
MFGSSQLVSHKHLRPKSIRSSETVDAMADDYMYFAAIQFVNSVKSESLNWHSPMLDDISAVKTWAKVNSGMIKMYEGEILTKLPISMSSSAFNNCAR